MLGSWYWTGMAASLAGISVLLLRDVGMGQFRSAFLLAPAVLAWLISALFALSSPMSMYEQYSVVGVRSLLLIWMFLLSASIVWRPITVFLVAAQFHFLYNVIDSIIEMALRCRLGHLCFAPFG